MAEHRRCAGQGGLRLWRKARAPRGNGSQRSGLMAVDDLAEDVEASLPRSKQAFPEWFTTNPKYISPLLATRTPIPQAWATPFGWTSPPQILDAVQSTDLQKDAYKLAFAVREAVDPLSLPPGVPDDVFKALQQAMIETCNDP